MLFIHLCNKQNMHRASCLTLELKMLWGENRGKWKGWQLPCRSWTQDTSGLSCQCSAIHWATTAGQPPHNPLYVLHTWYWIVAHLASHVWPSLNHTHATRMWLICKRIWFLQSETWFSHLPQFFGQLSSYSAKGSSNWPNTRRLYDCTFTSWVCMCVCVCVCVDFV